MGESGQESQRKKRIKTESGHWIKASYKSNAYKEWKERHKIDAPLAGEGVAITNQKLEATRGPFRHGRHRRGQGAKGTVADLKPKAVIFKNRQKREALEHRRKTRAKMKTKKKKS